MKKTIKVLIIILILFVGSFTFTGCESKEDKKVITDYNGVYKKGKNTFNVISINDKTLKYYVIDEYDNKNYGTLEFKNGVAINDDFDEVVKLTLKGKDLVVETKNVTNFKDGVYKKISDMTLDKYYNENYGLDKYFGNKYTGKYTNEDGTVYIYQPIKKYITFVSNIKEHIVSCEINLEEHEDLTCDIIDEKYKISLDNNTLTYIAVNNDESLNYTGTFTKDGELSKLEIIENFDPFYLFDEE